MATLTAYPDAHVETTTVDGFVQESYTDTNGITWASIQGGTGTASSDSAADSWCIDILADSVSDRWRAIRRGIFLFDTSIITDTNNIDSATFTLVGTAKADTDVRTPNINVYASAPASNTGLVAGDYDSFGTTEFSTSITYGSWNTSGDNDFVLNASGLAAVDATGVTKLGIRNANYDVADVEPTWVSGQDMAFKNYMADQTGTTSDPKLVVNHSASVSVISIMVQHATYPLVN